MNIEDRRQMPHCELFHLIKKYLAFKSFNENDAIQDHPVTICVRKRSLNRKEVAQKEVDVITIPTKNELIVHKINNNLPKCMQNQVFQFDYAFDETCSNEMVYSNTAQPLIKTIFEGGFVTCLAYGQTGSGKTHTMAGKFSCNTQDCQGLNAMTATDILRLTKSAEYRHLNLVVWISFFEILSGTKFDFLSSKAGPMSKDERLSEKVVWSVDEMLKLVGNLRPHSSRSHAIFQIYLRPKSDFRKLHGKFSLVDLAGNDRRGGNSANRQRMVKVDLNKRIRASDKNNIRSPTKVSKLSQVLDDCFVESNSRICVIATVSPGVNSCEHTLKTLRYVERFKELRAGDVQINTSDDSEDENDRTLTPGMFNSPRTMEIMKENMLENLMQTSDKLLQTYKLSVKLLRLTNDVIYVEEGYCKSWEALIENALAYLVKSKEIVAEYKAKMSDKGEQSRKINRKFSQ